MVDEQTPTLFDTLQGVWELGVKADEEEQEPLAEEAPATMGPASWK